MNKFKVFFTDLAFVWLLGCGIWSIFHFFPTGEVAWLGLLVNAWALPFWMLLRYRWPGKFSGDQREAPAFAAVLSGLAVALFTDSEKGQPVYLAIYNLFVFLIYIFHLSALGHPGMPDAGSRLPRLAVADGRPWDPAKYCQRENLRGVLLVFLRGSFCAGSRSLVAQLAGLLPELRQHRVGLVLFGTEPVERWRNFIGNGEQVEIERLEASAAVNHPFVAASAAPLLLRPRIPAAARPSLWLLDGEGNILWRYLPGNYRVPGDAALLRGQLFRVAGDQ